MAVVVEQYVEHFDRNFDEIKEEMYQQIPKEFPTFLKTEQTQRAFVKKSYMGGLGLPQKNRDLQNIPFDQAPQGPTAFYQPVNYRLGYQIERQTIEDELWGLLGSRPRSMLQGAAILMDMVGTDILNNGFVLQKYDFGGLPLFATNHLREDKAATWGNLINSNLPITVETVFNAIVNLLYNLKDSRGFPIAYQGVINLYVPSINPTLWRQAIEVEKSVMNPGTSDNRINALLQKFSIVVQPLRFLTNTAHWFIGWEPSAPSYGLTMVVRTNPEISSLRPFNDNPDAWFSRMRMRFVAGYENKRGVGAVGA